MDLIGRSFQRFQTVFGRKGRPAIIGMVHILPLPGTPRYNSNTWEDVMTTACNEAETLKNGGVDGILLENMHDIPYLNRKVGPEIVAAMTSVAVAVKKTVGSLPCGLQILAGCNRESVAVAKAASLDFVRCEGYVFSHVADEGVMDSDAGSLLRYRKMIDAENVLVFTDIKKKHSSHAITADIDIAEFAKAAEFFLTDGVIVTGMHTGQKADTKEVQKLKDNIKVPIVIGSGVTYDNISEYMNADAIIIGSHFKENGTWYNRLSVDRLKTFMTRFNAIS